jgi:hypothetical protein
MELPDTHYDEPSVPPSLELQPAPK